MAEEIGFENGRNSNFQGLVTLTLDPAIRHTVVHHSSTSTCIPNFIEIEETFCGRTDGHFSPSNIIRSTFGSRPKNGLAFRRLLVMSLSRQSGNELLARTCILKNFAINNSRLSRSVSMPATINEVW